MNLVLAADTRNIPSTEVSETRTRRL